MPNRELLLCARAMALFTTSLPVKFSPTRDQIDEEIMKAVRLHHGYTAA
ncbi:hypothetical protein QF035_010922 [Streptomyces umbrinus]|uniref:Uncharacterized protein n=1 Tax=Streptomyces umbrinus TaxID=67370 RepID=A0ABU0TBZ6_9ACTN|nr:hypothetical protein [Streptomyces umbrinus]MDQ1033340.1 hypothetical protein [Streptomyces umbrinus]